MAPPPRAQQALRPEDPSRGPSVNIAPDFKVKRFGHLHPEFLVCSRFRGHSTSRPERASDRSASDAQGSKGQQMIRGTPARPPAPSLNHPRQPPIVWAVMWPSRGPACVVAGRAAQHGGTKNGLSQQQPRSWHGREPVVAGRKKPRRVIMHISRRAAIVGAAVLIALVSLSAA